MSTITKEFTKEQLQQIEAAAKEVMWPVVWSEKKAREHFSEKITPKVVLKLARIALASIEAEAVPDERDAFEAFMEGRFKDTIDRKRVKNGDQGYFAWDMIVAWIVWQGRAAMLQGAEPVSNRYELPDGWVACSERMPDEGSKVIVFRPRADESNDPPVKTATYKGGREYYHGFDCYCEPTHWMPLPAEPQQEVKS